MNAPIFNPSAVKIISYNPEVFHSEDILLVDVPKLNSLISQQDESNQTYNTSFNYSGNFQKVVFVPSQQMEQIFGVKPIKKTILMRFKNFLKKIKNLFKRS